MSLHDVIEQFLLIVSLDRAVVHRIWKSRTISRVSTVT